MKMIIGGAFQGKLAFALRETDELKKEDFIDGTDCSLTEVFTAKGIFHFHEYIRRLMQETPDDIDTFPEELIRRNPGLVIVTDEIGYGIVPMDPFDRSWREQTGRICTKLAAYSDSVVRVVMGVGQKIR